MVLRAPSQQKGTCSEVGIDVTAGGGGLDHLAYQVRLTNLPNGWRGNEMERKKV